MTRDELFAIGCHLDDYDRRVAAGESPEVVAHSTHAEWLLRQEAQRALDAAREGQGTPSGAAVRVEQTDPAVARITAPGSRRRR